MGLLKKVFKPVSKVLDKIIPNEVKPFLPYAAAFAPVFGPTAGLFGKGIMQRALLSGGANILGQLSQEGNEGDINLLSAGIGALTGAMTSPGFKSRLEGFRPDSFRFDDYGAVGTDLAPSSFLDKATNVGIDTLQKGSDILLAGKDNPFSKAGLKAALVPATTATGDLMFAQAKRDQDEYDRLMEEEAAAAGEDSAARAFAIRQAMEAYGFSEDEILDAIAAAGYKKGGRVRLESGGGLLDMLKESIIAEPFKGEKGYIEEGVDMEEFKESEPEEIESEETEEGMFKIKDKPIFLLPMNMKKGGRVGLEFGGIPGAVETIEQKPKEFLIDKLKVTQMPGQSEMRAIIEAMYNDTDGVMPEDRKKEFYELYSNQMYRNGDMDRAEFEFIQTEILGKNMNQPIAKKDGGLMATRINMENGGDLLALGEGFKSERLNRMARDMFGKTLRELNADEMEMLREEFNIMKGVTEAKDGGLMNLGGKEMDLRGGGFVPIGKKERADDVPARLSKNEFVMTADAVRAAGGGSVNKGAKRMYNLMHNLEARA